MNHRTFNGDLIMQVWFPPDVARHVVMRYQQAGRTRGVWDGPIDGEVNPRSWAMMRSLGFDPEDEA